MIVDLINFKATDGVILDGFIHKSNSKRIIIFTHGMGSNCFKTRGKIIAEKAAECNIDFFCYNNRGSELVRTVKKEVNGEKKKVLAGTTFEDVLEGYHDIKGAILKAIELGYTDIYLQGHSLGCTKTIYLYNRLKNENDEILKYIKGVILLSLVDIPRALKVYLNDKFDDYLKLAEEKETKNELYNLMPADSFIHPISVKSYLRYIKYNNEFNFAQYSNSEFEFEELNQIDVPIFMRWGNVNEMIEQDAKILSEMMNLKVKNPNKDIGYIDGADHGYSDKEDVLAEQIMNFIEKGVL